MKLHMYSQWRFKLVLTIGTIVAAVLCVQCIRTYLYTDTVLVPQQAEREAERQVGALTTAARSAAITDPRALGPVIAHLLDTTADRVLWLRVLDTDSHLLVQGGDPQGTPRIPARWWQKVEAHEQLGVLVDTSAGKALVAMLPFRLPRAANLVSSGNGRPPSLRQAPGPGHPLPCVVEVAIPLKAVAGSFEGLRQNLIVGVLASLALLFSLAVLAVRAPQYLRGRYLESELQLARRVQSDLQPKPQSISPHIEFGALAVAADHVGGDFYDLFEADYGKIAIVLGDVSGKGIPAALLVSVLQGAIRSSTAPQHEDACERINRMLCERTAGERFATLFWGVFDPATAILRYVNAGHAAPMLIRDNQNHIERLDKGGPVLGLLPTAAYAAGSIQIEASDRLVLYSDGINEAANQHDQEFGEERIQQLIHEAGDLTPADLCHRIMRRVTAFASTEVPADDRTLMVVRFPPVPASLPCWDHIETGHQVVAC